MLHAVLHLRNRGRKQRDEDGLLVIDRDLYPTGVVSASESLVEASVVTIRLGRLRRVESRGPDRVRRGATPWVLECGKAQEQYSSGACYTVL